MYRDSFIYDFCFEFIPAFIGFILGLTLVGTVIGFGIFAIFDPPTCHAKGDKMGLEVNWSFWTGCMINLKGQWLDSSDVIPIERDGKIVFTTKPVVVIKNADQK